MTSAGQYKQKGISSDKSLSINVVLFMDEVTIQEVVNFHMEYSNNADELLKDIIKNVTDLAKRDLAEKLGAKCLYSGFTSSCKFCGQCVGDEMDNFQDIVKSGKAHQHRMDDYLSEQISMHGHPI